KNAALLRTVAEAAGACDAIRCHVDGFGAIDTNRALALVDQAENRLQCGRPPRPVTPEQSDDLAFIHTEINTMQNMGFAVIGMQFGYVQQFLATGLTHARLP